MSEMQTPKESGLRPFIRLLLAFVVIATAMGVGFLLDRLYFQAGQEEGAPAINPDAMSSPSATPSATAGAAAGDATQLDPLQLIGTIFYTSRVEGWHRIFAFIPGTDTPLLLLDGAYDNYEPVLSPDGSMLAFVSNRGGSSDLYVLHLADGSIRQITDTAAYEGHPTWSPDSLWIAYEAYYHGDLDIWILPVDGSQTPIMLTDHEGLDMSPAWDPNGRKIAFVSDREGSMDIFIADLDRPTDRFINVTDTEEIHEIDPAFSPDGEELLYTSMLDGVDVLSVIAVDVTSREREVVGQGRAGEWSPDGTTLLANLLSPQSSRLLMYMLDDGTQLSIGLPFVNGVVDYSWSPHTLADQLIALAHDDTSNSLYDIEMDLPESEDGRLNLVDLLSVQAPHPQLSDAADEAFEALRERTIQVTGWDFLGTLDYAFAGINEPLPPGYAYNDWLYTGRAFAFAEAALEAGWVEVVPEYFGAQVYWRVYVRIADQDSARGEPLASHPWDFNSRYADDPYAYDRGGTLKVNIPTGYYIDFTELALDFGFERLPALANWRTFYPGARYNEFVLRGDLSWEEAMLQLYPRTAIITPTPFRTPTPTPTRTPRPTPTPWWWRWRTPTPSATPVPPQATPTEG